MRVIVILNPSSGTAAYWRGGEGARWIVGAFREGGVEADVQVVAAKQLAERARRAAASTADVVVAAGGDGTVSAVAGALAGTPKPLGVLPLGTWNHFARDLGIPLRSDEAVRNIARGHVRAVDVGEVNGHVFINNSSIGVYPEVVAEREELRLRLGGGKWLALLAAVRATVRRFPLLTLSVEVGGQSVESTTPLLFVGNNRYEINLLSLGRRSRLDRGELCIYLVKAADRVALVKLALRSLLGLLQRDAQFEAGCVAELRAETRRRRVKVAKDGEVLSLRPPLYYRSCPGALRVLVPESQPPAPR